MTTFPARRARSGHHVGQKVGSRDNALPRRAGDAIVPQVAAEFVMAWAETQNKEVSGGCSTSAELAGSEGDG